MAAGRASALFAVLAGVGVALSTGGRTPPARGRPHAAAAAGLLVRGALVALVGLALVELDPPVAVILAYYGLLFWLATPLLRLRARTLGVLAAVWCVLGPVASHVLRAGREAWPGDQPGFAALAAPGELLRELTLTGYYPVLPWLTYLLAGMAVARLDLRSPRIAAALVGGGAAVAVVGVGGVGAAVGPGRWRAGARLGSRRTPVRHRPDGHLVVARRRGPAHGHAVRPRAHDGHRAHGAGGDAAAGPRRAGWWCGRSPPSGRCR